jgi:hypothetical protein
LVVDTDMMAAAVVGERSAGPIDVIDMALAVVKTVFVSGVPPDCRWPCCFLVLSCLFALGYRI